MLVVSITLRLFCIQGGPANFRADLPTSGHTAEDLSRADCLLSHHTWVGLTHLAFQENVLKVLMCFRVQLLLGDMTGRLV